MNKEIRILNILDNEKDLLIDLIYLLKKNKVEESIDVIQKEINYINGVKELNKSKK